MNHYQRILVALDLSEDSMPVCNKAVALAAANNAEILIVHVVEYVYQMNIAYDPLFYPGMAESIYEEEELVKIAEKQIQKLISALPDNNYRTFVVGGVPKIEILQLAEEQQCDLIICGSHGRSGFELLLGSTANAILHHANCDVLAVRTTG